MKSLPMKQQKTSGRHGQLSLRQKCILVLAGTYVLLLAGLTAFSSQILAGSLPGVRVSYAGDGYIGDVFYNTVLPEKCLFANADGTTCIWLVTEKDTPLGKRLYVHSQDAAVIRSSDGICAIRPILDLNQPVVREADQELSDGAQVRLREEEP